MTSLDEKAEIKYVILSLGKDQYKLTFNVNTLYDKVPLIKEMKDEIELEFKTVDKPIIALLSSYDLKKSETARLSDALFALSFDDKVRANILKEYKPVKICYA